MDQPESDLVIKKKVLVTTTTFPRWKADTVPNFVYELEKRLGESFKIVVLAPHYLGANKKEMMGNLQIYRYRYFWPVAIQKLCYGSGITANIRRRRWLYLQIPFLLVAQFLAIRKLIKKENIGMIHAHWAVPQGVIAAVIKAIFDIPFIVTIHGSDVFGSDSIIRKIAIRFTLKRSKICTANSIMTKKKVERIFSTRSLKVIPMGVNMELFNPNKFSDLIKEQLSANGPMLLFVGRLTVDKGAKFLINALPGILDKNPNVKLIMIGEGNQKTRLQKQVISLGLKEVVTFLGSVPNEDLPEYFASADVVIGPTTSEGLGLVFIEALASGTCVVASNVGGVPDIIKHNITGLLVKEKNSIEITQAVNKLLANKDLRDQLVSNGLNYVGQTFSWQVVCRQFTDVYNNAQIIT